MTEPLDLDVLERAALQEPYVTQRERMLAEKQCALIAELRQARHELRNAREIEGYAWAPVVQREKARAEAAEFVNDEYKRRIEEAKAIYDATLVGDEGESLDAMYRALTGDQ